MKQNTDALATALSIFWLKAEGLKLKAGFEKWILKLFINAKAQSLPSLLNGTSQVLFSFPFILLNRNSSMLRKSQQLERTKEPRLPNLWLELQIHGAQSEAVPLCYTSTLCSFTIPFTLHSAKFSEAGLALWLCVVAKLKAGGLKLKVGFERWLLKLFINGKAQGLPSLIGGTGLFLFLDEKKQKSRLPNLWLELQIHGAQSEAVPLRCTSTLCSFSIPFTLHSAKFSEAVLALWICVVAKLKAEGLKFKAVFKLKVESERLKATRSLVIAKVLNRLSLFPNPVNQQSYILREEVSTLESEIKFGRDIQQSQAIGSVGPVKRRAGSMASGLKDRFTLIYSSCLLFFISFHALVSLVFWFLFHLRKKELELAAQEAGKLVWKGLIFKSAAQFFRLNAEIKRLKASAWIHILGWLKDIWKRYLEHEFKRSEFQKRYLKDRALRKKAEKEAKANKHSFIGFAVACMLLMGVNLQAQELKPLQIGEHIPAITLNNILGKEAKPIELASCKGKIILLDFWSTYCGSCIANMSHLFELRASLKDSLVVIPVSGEQKERIQKVWSTNPNLKSLAIYTVYEDSQLKKLFPHQLFPHLVWIDQQGRYLGTTDAEYANVAYVKSLYQDAPNVIKQKIETDLFDVSKIALHQYLGLDSSTHIYPFQAGLQKQSKLVVLPDSSLRYYSINAQLVNLYAIAAETAGLAYQPKRRKIQIPDQQAFEYQKSFGYQSDWDAQYAVSYERFFPKGTTTAQIHAQMLQDLNRHFCFEGKMENSNTPVLALKVKPSLIKHPTQGIRLNSWLYQVQQIPGIPWVIDQTDLAKSILMPALPKVPTLEAIQESIKPYGFILEATTVNLPMFHLNPN